MSPSTSSTPKKKGGEWKEPFLEQLQVGGSISAAAEAVGIDRTTVWYARRADPEFARTVEEITQWCIQRVEDTLFTRAVSGETTELIFFLKNRKPEVYGDRLRAEEREKIKVEAERAVRDQFFREMQGLPPTVRKALMRAVDADAAAG